MHAQILSKQQNLKQNFKILKHFAVIDITM